jgi:hypothetical protein
MGDIKSRLDKSPLDAFTDWLSQVQDDMENRFPSDGTYTSASGEIVVLDSGHGKLNEKEAEKALNNLKKREKRSKFRQINDIRKIRIGDKVRSRNGFPMVVTGVFQDCLTDYLNGTLYLDFAENEGDVWEEDLGDVEWDGNWFSILWKKITR